MTRPELSHNLSRRSWLAVCGTGLTALAGCSEIRGGDSEKEHEYDADRLDEIAAIQVPDFPNSFPVTVTKAMLHRHENRARELLSAIPKQPDIPNGVISRRIRNGREQLKAELDDKTNESAWGPRRLSSARHLRGDAAEINGFYRASTDAVDYQTIVDRREKLRADHLAFVGQWSYRGDVPEKAVVVNAELESLDAAVRRYLDAWPPVPEDPGTDVMAVGKVLRHLESGRSALTDATLLRTSYLDNANNPYSHRVKVTHAAHRLNERAMWDRRLIHEYIDIQAEVLPNNRELVGSPAGSIYSHARRAAQSQIRGIDSAEQLNYHARMMLRAAQAIAGIRTFSRVFEAIERGEYTTPDTVEPVASARESAVQEVKEAWEMSPKALSTVITRPAYNALEYGQYELEQSPDERGVVQALAKFEYARLFAQEVQDVVAIASDELSTSG